MTLELDERLLALTKARHIPYRQRRKTVMNDTHPEDRLDLFPETETRHHSERYTRPLVTDLNALEAEMRDAGPGDTIETTPELMDQAIRNRHPLLAEREHTHGDFAATALIAQRFKDISKSTPNWNASLTDIQRESLEGIFTKIARILSGDPNHKDHWSDIEGGARLVSERL